MKFHLKSIHNLLSNVVHKQTDRQTLPKTLPPFAKEVINNLWYSNSDQFVHCITHKNSWGFYHTSTCCSKSYKNICLKRLAWTRTFLIVAFTVLITVQQVPALNHLRDWTAYMHRFITYDQTLKTLILNYSKTPSRFTWYWRRKTGVLKCSLIFRNCTPIQFSTLKC